MMSAVDSVYNRLPCPT